MTARALAKTIRDNLPETWESSIAPIWHVAYWASELNLPPEQLTPGAVRALLRTPGGDNGPLRGGIARPGFWESVHQAYVILVR